MAGKLHPKQLAQAGATNGQVLGYNTTSNQWGPTTNSASISSSSASATGSTTTASASDAQIDSMTLTPGAGTYLVMFSTSVAHSATQSLYVSIYANGSKVNESECRLTVTDMKVQASVFPLSTQAVVTVAAGQVIEVKWRTTGATATAYQRILTLLKIG
jgi:hypothetical protein